MHLQDARCMNSFSNRSAGRGLNCIVQLCSKKGRQGDKGKVIGLRSEGIGYFRKSFQPAQGKGKGMMRRRNIRPTIPLFKKKFFFKAFLPNLQLISREKVSAHANDSQPVPGVWPCYLHALLGAHQGRFLIHRSSGSLWTLGHTPAAFSVALM